MAITKKQRKDAEALVYKVMDQLDTTGTNTEYYKKLFSKMSDAQFYNFFKKDICSKCRRVRIILPCKLFSSIPAWRCTKCGYAWKK